MTEATAALIVGGLATLNAGYWIATGMWISFLAIGLCLAAEIVLLVP